MKYVRLFEGFKEEDIQAICKKYGIKNYTINTDGSIDVDGDVDLQNKNLDKLPLKFRRVNDNFFCDKNKLTTLEGAPNWVGGGFFCDRNKLTTLVGSPNYVGGGFFCGDNKLTTLEGAPNYIENEFNFNYNNILTFEGAPSHIGWDLYCYDTPIYNIWMLFDNYSKVELLNDYDALRIEDGRGICILSRLNGFLEDIKESKITNVEIKLISEYYEIR